MASYRVYFFGHFLFSQIFWHSAAKTDSPPCLISSEETLSSPGDSPACRLRTAFPTSAITMGGLSTSASGLGKRLESC
ncbi:hypothetical protein DPMN_155596 [Dreissena polymorpha]|uniref:Uncharacterized protein n=1 Tax=Dreissena polymorpha TaxID=45954 RepID=A0A9D4JA37_DREPO|nr:hypothetical protein DPMN_155596 [Dreissena polymorpha]